MKVVTNTALATRRGRQAILLSFGGLGLLLGGLVLSLRHPSLVLYTYGALILGTIMSWVGVALSERWLRPPRADRALAEAMKGAGRAYVLYNWTLPADHVLLTPTGLVVIAVFNQEGPVIINGEKWREQRPLWKRIFSLGRRPVHCPRRLLELETSALGEALASVDPELEEVPLRPLAVFTHPYVSLTLSQANPPAVRADGLRDWLRQQGGRTLTPARRRKLERVLDQLSAPG